MGVVPGRWGSFGVVWGSFGVCSGVVWGSLQDCSAVVWVSFEIFLIFFGKIFLIFCSRKIKKFTISEIFREFPLLPGSGINDGPLIVVWS